MALRMNCSYFKGTAKENFLFHQTPSPEITKKRNQCFFYVNFFIKVSVLGGLFFCLVGWLSILFCFVSVIKHSDQKQPWEERAYLFGLLLEIIIHH